MELRPLTKKEQLEWLKNFLESQIKSLQEELEECNKELEKVKKKEK